MKSGMPLLAVIALSLCVGIAPAQEKLNWKAAKFELPDIAGKKHSPAKDKIVVMVWFDHECVFTKRLFESKDGKPSIMQELATKYSKKGIQWLAIDSTPGRKGADVAAATKGWGLKHPVLLDGEGKVAKLYGAKVSAQVFITRGEKILYQGGIDDGPRGKAKKHFLADALAQVVAGQEVKPRSTKPYGRALKKK